MKEKVGLKQAVGFSVSLVMFDSLIRWTVTHQASMSMGFPRQECWIGLPFPSPVDLVNLRTEAASPSLEGRFFTTQSTGKPSFSVKYMPTNQQALSSILVWPWLSNPKVYLRDVVFLQVYSNPRGNILNITFLSKKVIMYLILSFL